jgi:hypothetical protein
MKRNILTPEPGVTEALHLKFPDRVLPRGHIVFLGPFSDDEMNQARIKAGLQPKLRSRKRKAYRDGTYCAYVDLRADREELMKIFRSFLDETSLTKATR